jgi:hypothetical protein
MGPDVSGLAISIDEGQLLGWSCEGWRAGDGDGELTVVLPSSVYSLDRRGLPSVRGFV